MLIDFSIIITALLVHRMLLVRMHNVYFRNGWERDAAEHIQLITQLKKNDKKHISHFLIPSTMTNPYLYHSLCRFFDSDFLKRNAYVPNLILYLLSGCLGYWLLSEYLLFSSLDFGGHELPLFLVFFIAMPVNNFFVAANTSYITLSERYFSLMLTACSVFLFALFELSGNQHYFIASLAAAVFLNMASKFARQAYVLFFLFYSVFTFSHYSLIHLLLGLLTPLLIWRRYYWKSLISQIKYFGIYRTILSPSTNQRRGLETFEFSFGNLLSVSKEPLRSFVFYLPVFLILFYYHHPLWIFNLVPIAIYIFVSNRWLSFIGESFRYIEFALYYFIPVNSLVLYQEYGAEWLFAYIFVSVFYFFHFYRKINKDAYDSLDIVIDRTGINSSSVLLTYSMRTGLNISARVGCKTLWWQPGGLTDKSLWKKYIGTYPFLISDFLSLLDEREYTHIVCKKSELNMMSEKPSFDVLKLVYEDYYYVVYSPTT